MFTDLLFFLGFHYLLSLSRLLAFSHFQQCCSKMNTRVDYITLILTLSNAAAPPTKNKKGKKWKLLKARHWFYMYYHTSSNTRTSKCIHTVLCIYVTLCFPKSFMYFISLYLHVCFISIFFDEAYKIIKPFYSLVFQIPMFHSVFTWSVLQLHHAQLSSICPFKHYLSKPQY